MNLTVIINIYFAVYWHSFILLCPNQMVTAVRHFHGLCDISAEK